MEVKAYVKQVIKWKLRKSIVFFLISENSTFGILSFFYLAVQLYQYRLLFSSHFIVDQIFFLTKYWLFFKRRKKKSIERRRKKCCNELINIRVCNTCCVKHTIETRVKRFAEICSSNIIVDALRFDLITDAWRRSLVNIILLRT